MVKFSYPFDISLLCPNTITPLYLPSEIRFFLTLSDMGVNNTNQFYRCPMRPGKWLFV